MTLAALLSVAALLIAPAVAQTISVNHATMAMTVGQTAEIYVESHGGSAPGIAGGTCGSYPPGKPSDMVAITHFHQYKVSIGGTLTLDVKAQHPGRCYVRYSTSGNNGRQALTQTDFTVKP